MKIAVIGSRKLKHVDLVSYVPKTVTEIVSGGALGIDSCAADYAKVMGIKLTEFLPDYRRYGKGAPIRRNKQIAEYADEGIAFWDGKSKGTKNTIELFKKLGKPITVILIQ